MMAIINICKRILIVFFGLSPKITKKVANVKNFCDFLI